MKLRYAIPAVSDIAIHTYIIKLNKEQIIIVFQDNYN